MLRQKLLLVLGSVIALMLAVGVVAVLLLQSVLRDLEHVSSVAIAGTSSTLAAQLRLGDIQAEIERARATSDTINASKLHTAQQVVRDEVDRMTALESVSEPVIAPCQNLRAAVNKISQALDRLALDSFAANSSALEEIQNAATDAHEQLSAVQDGMRAYTQSEERRTTTRFRWVALGLGLAFVLVINISIMVLSRMAGMILKPVERLVDASRRLAREEFSHRVQLDQDDEFGELAKAYNSLAAQLQSNEDRKIETLHQVARTLNHELNNAIAIIQLQLELASKKAGIDGPNASRLHEIQQSLTRMAGTVAAFTRVRRIVLTDYLSGVKMLDLEASVADEPAPASETTTELVPHAHA